MAQPIKYYETTIPAADSASQIIGLIVKYGCERTSIDWDEQHQPSAVSFVIRDAKHGLVPVRLIARTEAVLKVLLKAKPYHNRLRLERAEYEQKLREQAGRIIWRHLKDLVEQQLLAVAIGQMDVVQAFLAGVLMLGPDSQVQTMGDLVAQFGAVAPGGGFLQISSGAAA